MQLSNKNSEWFIPDGSLVTEALARTTHLAISAHQDDIEIMAYHGIANCFGQKDKWFSAVVATNGAGSPRNDIYAGYSDDKMKETRRQEQKKAAYIGEYSALALLDYESSDVKDKTNRKLIEDIKNIIKESKPDIIYTHNPADRHDTHLGVAVKVIQAIRELDKQYRPKRLYGCEVWRSLDWLPDEHKILLDVSQHPNISAALLGVYDSQISGGKRYDLAASGRRLANATFSASHCVDESSALSCVLDMSLLVEDDSLQLVEFIKGCISKFEQEVLSKLNRLI